MYENEFGKGSAGKEKDYCEVSAYIEDDCGWLDSGIRAERFHHL
jgi:hypothetical protein